MPSILFTNTSNTAVLTAADGSTTTSVYDLSGELISTSTAASGVSAMTTADAYDNLGRLRMVTDALGNKSYFLYDGDGRKVADITADGALTETAYDAAGRVTDTIQYATKLTSTQLASLVDSNGKPANVTLASVRPAASPADRWEWNVYDQANRLVETIDATGSATVYTYDGANRLVATTAYATALPASALSGFETTPPATVQQPTADAAHDRTTRNFYSDDGLLVGTLDGDGALTQYVYDGAGEKTRTIAYATFTGASVRASGTFAQLLASAGTNAADRQTDYVYDGKGELRYTIEKNSSAALGGGTNSARLTEYAYDVSGNLIHTLVYAGSIAAPASNGAYTLPYVQGQISSLSLASNSANRMTMAVYDTANRLAFSIDAAGGVTQYVYDAAGRVTKSIAFAQVSTGGNADQSYASWQSWASTNGSNTGNRVGYTLYDGVSRPVYRVDAQGYVTESQYDALGRVVKTIRYPASYTVTDSTTTASLKSAIGSVPATAVITTLAYDVAGRLTDVTNGVGAVTHYAYDALSEVTDTTVAYGTGDAATTHTTYDTAGRVLTLTKAYGASEATTTAYSYDATGNVLTVTTASGAPEAATTTNGYDQLGQLIQVTDAAGAVTHYGYDTLGNRVTVTDPRGNTTTSYYDQLDRLVLTVDTNNYATATTYSLGGAVSSVIHYATAVAGTPSATTRPTITTNATEDATTGFALDKLDRVTGVTDAMGYGEQYTLDAFGDRVSVRNKLGGVTTNVFDRRGLLVAETLPESSVNSAGTTVAVSVTNTYAYDARGNRIQMVEADHGTDASGNSVALAEKRTTNYAYDKMDRLVTTSHDAVYVTNSSTLVTATAATVPTETVKYDLRGNVVEQDDAAGARTLSYYNDDNQKIAQISPTGTLSAWTYDDNGNVLTATTYGDNVTLPTAPGGTPPAPVNIANFRLTSYTYDQNNRLLTSSIANILTGAFNGTSYATATGAITTTNVYDAAGDLVQTTTPDGARSYFFYDKADRKVAEVDPDNYLTTWTLDADGNVTAETRYATMLADAVTTASSWTTLQSHAASGSLHANDRTTSFTYDRNGNRLTETRTGVATWTVNASTGTLTQATTSATVTYSYNGLGEVVSKREATGDTTSYTYDTAGRQVSVADAAFTDYAGNMTQEVTANAYDGLGDLTRTTVTGTAGSSGTRATTYAYGANGWLASTTDASGFTTSYGYDIAGRTVRASYARVKSDGTSVTEAQATQYDLAGRVTQQAVATLSGSTWTMGDKSQTQYDAYGEVSAKGVNGMAQQSYAYDAAGRVARATQNDGTTQLYVYDQAGHLTLTVTSASTTSGGAPADLSGQTVPGALNLLTNNGAYALDSRSQNAVGMAVTIGVFDKRGQQVTTRQPYRDLSSGTVQTLVSSQSYDAFGEVAQTVDARGGVTDYAYNAEGKIISSMAPTANWTSENGAIGSGRATQTNYYDLSGRLVGVRDANGNLNTLLLRAGTGYGGDDADTLKEFHADGGIFTRGYDAFGDMRTNSNEVGKTEAYVYDDMDRLVEQDHQLRPANSVGNATGKAIQLIDYYSYDGLGQRLIHTNSQLGTAVKETTDYDAQGRIVSMVDLGGDTTTYSYAWSNAIATTGLGTFGGWTKTTNDPATGNPAETEKLDVFGREVAKTDFGGHVFTYSFDKAGRGVETSVSTGGDTRTGYFNTGLVANITDGTLSGSTFTARAISSYGYDANGNRTREAYFVSGVSQENATVAWDAMNRMTSFTDTGAGGADNATITYEYDLAGNVRHIAASYHALDDQGNVSSTAASQDDWYKYDSMNRFVTTQGIFTGARGSGTIGLGSNNTQGVILTYDAAGERMSATHNYREIDYEDYANGVRQIVEYDPHSENYSYTADGYLAKVMRDGSTTMASYDYDVLGRVTGYAEYAADGSTVSFSRHDSYNNRNQVTDESTYSRVGSDQYKTTTHNDYNAETSLGSGNYTGAYMGGLVTRSYTTTTKNDSGAVTAGTWNAYTWWDDAETTAIAYKADVNKSTEFTTNYSYDKLNHLSSVAIADGRPRTVSFVTTADGTIIQRDENDQNGSTGDPRQIYYYFDGVRVGDVSNDGTSDTDYATSITAHTAAQGTGAFRNGATAGTSYANFDQSYDPVNGLNYDATSSRYTVNDGDTLESIAQTVWGDSSLWYMLADANGMDGTETLVAGQDLVIPNKVANIHNNASTYRVYDPNDAIGNTAPTDPKPAKHHSNHCGAFGQILLVAVAVAVAVALPEVAGTYFGAGGLLGGGVLDGAVTGVVASAASQAVGVATGIQNKFSFTGVALAAIGGGIGAGLGPNGLFGANGAFPADKVGGAFASGALRGLATEALTEGIGVASGLQDKFDWAGIAAAGIGDGIGGAFGHDVLGLQNGGTPSIGQSAAMGTASAIANAASRSLLTGTDFGDNLIRALPSVIGQTVGNLAAGQITSWDTPQSGARAAADDDTATSSPISIFGVDPTADANRPQIATLGNGTASSEAAAVQNMTAAQGYASDGGDTDANEVVVTARRGDSRTDAQYEAYEAADAARYAADGLPAGDAYINPQLRDFGSLAELRAAESDYDAYNSAYANRTGQNYADYADGKASYAYAEQQLEANYALADHDVNQLLAFGAGAPILAGAGGALAVEAGVGDLVLSGYRALTGSADISVADLVAERQATARTFYQSTNWDAAKIESHLEGIDFTQPVKVETLPSGTSVIQYQIPGNPTGNYFASVDTPPDMLGFNTAGRVASPYVTESEVEVLRSIAADTTNNPNIPVQFRGTGGGTQYFTKSPQVFRSYP